MKGPPYRWPLFVFIILFNCSSLLYILHWSLDENSIRWVLLPTLNVKFESECLGWTGEREESFRCGALGLFAFGNDNFTGFRYVDGLWENGQ